MTGWELPKQTYIGGRTYHLHTDYREILEIFSCLQDESQPEFLRWYLALALFFEEAVPEEDFQQAAEYFRWFVNCGREETKDPGPQLAAGCPGDRSGCEQGGRAGDPCPAISALVDIPGMVSRHWGRKSICIGIHPG